jgi:hypothetical protein
VNTLQIPCEPGEVSDGYHTFNELYAHRHALFLNLMKCWPRCSWFSRKHEDGSEMAGWFIAGIHLPTGAISYHLPESFWEKAVWTGAKELELGENWDGPTSADVVSRLHLNLNP